MPKYSKAAALVILFAAGCLLNFPYLDFQEYLSQGDHGRDLYAFMAALKGQMPYRDFWWVYGPAMPYYYGLFFKVFGVNIKSVLLGKAALNVSIGLFFFLALAQNFSLLAALLAAGFVMAFHPDFFYTYNHIGASALTAALFWQHLSYKSSKSKACLWLSLGLVFFLGLVKINFGFVGLIMSIAVFWPERRTQMYFDTLLLLAAWLAVYGYYLYPLPWLQVRQCLPYLNGDDPYNTRQIWQTLPALFLLLWKKLCANGSYIALLAIATPLAGVWGKKRKWHWVLSYALVFTFLSLHEYWKSEIAYRSYWAYLPAMLFIFSFLFLALEGLGKNLQKIFFSCLFVILIVGTIFEIRRVESFKVPTHFINLPRLQIYTTNAPEWIRTLTDTNEAMDKTIAKGEYFLALPFDSIYYFLRDQISPTWEIVFFDYVKISQIQDREIIQQIEKHKVNTILISNRSSSSEAGLGVFGKTYALETADFIRSHFIESARFGEWKSQGGWAWDYGTLILKRH